VFLFREEREKKRRLSSLRTGGAERVPQWKVRGLPEGKGPQTSISKGHRGWKG